MQSRCTHVSSAARIWERAEAGRRSHKQRPGRAYCLSTTVYVPAVRGPSTGAAPDGALPRRPLGCMGSGNHTREQEERGHSTRARVDTCTCGAGSVPRTAMSAASQGAASGTFPDAGPTSPSLSARRRPSGYGSTGRMRAAGPQARPGGEARPCLGLGCPLTHPAPACRPASWPACPPGLCLGRPSTAAPLALQHSTTALAGSWLPVLHVHPGLLARN